MSAPTASVPEPPERLVSGEQFLLLMLGAVGMGGVVAWQGPQRLEQLPGLNALLNLSATILLIAGYVAIKRGRERAHTRLMLLAFAASIVFLASYLTYHFELKATTGQSGKPFPGQGLIRPVYFTLLLTHVVLAATVPFLAGATIWLGMRDRRAAHRRLARWTFPIWLYVSVTGVVIYVLLYLLPF